ncbi:unnamed protein product [Caenorhabditis nigoni]
MKRLRRRKSSSRNHHLKKRISLTPMTFSSLTEPVETRPRKKATFSLWTFSGPLIWSLMRCRNALARHKKTEREKTKGSDYFNLPELTKEHQRGLV